MVVLRQCAWRSQVVEGVGWEVRSRPQVAPSNTRTSFFNAGVPRRQRGALSTALLYAVLMMRIGWGGDQ